MNTSHRFYCGILLFLSITILSACGSLQIDFEDRGPEESNPGQEPPPVSILVARETALNFVREQYGESAPSTDLLWTESHVTPESLVGATNFRFLSQDWTMTIAFPIVAPDATIYSIELFNSTSGFQWMGQVDAQGAILEMADALQDLPVVAWAGRFKILAEGAGLDDYFVVIPEGVGAVGVEAVDEDLESMIALHAASDAEYVHIWGALTCGVDDFNNCRIRVERIRGLQEITDPETVDGWEGVLYNGPPEPRSGGDDYFALIGDFPVQYGIWAMDEGLRSNLEALRDTRTAIRVWGTLVAGIPDWNGTQITVDRFEIVPSPSGAIPPAPLWDAPDRGWLTYENQRYGYRFEYPPETEIEEIGVQGFPSDENGLPVGGFPDGVTLENYFAYLEEKFGNNLCVGVKYSLGYIYISAAENAEARYAACGRTGVGAFEIIQREEVILIDGMPVTATGMEVKGEGETLAMHNETMIVRLPDGTRIEYGSVPRPDATYEDYRVKTRDTLLQILETFEFID